MSLNKFKKIEAPPLLFEDLYPEKPFLKGIAKLADESPLALEQNQVDYYSLPYRSVLNWCQGTRMSDVWTINPYRGCEFGCVYCYARYTHEFMELWDWRDFERKIFIKENPAEILRKELEKGKGRDSSIVIGSATDPYQPAERWAKSTRQILEVLSDYSGLDITIITKSILPTRDMDIMKRISGKSNIEIHETITTTDMNLARIIEPRAPTPHARLRTVKTLVENEIVAGVHIMPILPGITDKLEMLENLFKEVAETKAHFIVTQPVFLRPCSIKRYYPFLEEYFPHLLKAYERVYSKSSEAPSEYHEKIKKLVDELRTKYPIESRRPPKHIHNPDMEEEKLPLFAEMSQA